MSGLLEGKVVLVTGGASGIGLACAKAMLDQGARPIIADIDESNAVLAARRLGDSAIPIRYDVADIASTWPTIEKIWERCGRIDIVVNNAAVFDMAPLLEVTHESFQRLFAVNVQGLFFTMQAVASLMDRDRLGGNIINMASQAGRRGEPASSVYAATKAAVISLTQSAALSLIDKKIRVNAIAPGVIETPLWDKIDALYSEQYGASPNSQHRLAAAEVPARRMGTPAEVAAAAVFLASQQSEYIVGQTINVDGGNIMS